MIRVRFIRKVREVNASKTCFTTQTRQEKIAQGLPYINQRGSKILGRELHTGICITVISLFTHSRKAGCIRTQTSVGLWRDFGLEYRDGRTSDSHSRSRDNPCHDDMGAGIRCSLQQSTNNHNIDSHTYASSPSELLAEERCCYRPKERSDYTGIRFIQLWFLDKD